MEFGVVVYQFENSYVLQGVIDVYGQQKVVVYEVELVFVFGFEFFQVFFGCGFFIMVVVQVEVSGYFFCLKGYGFFMLFIDCVFLYKLFVLFVDFKYGFKILLDFIGKNLDQVYIIKDNG